MVNKYIFSIIINIIFYISGIDKYLVQSEELCISPPSTATDWDLTLFEDKNLVFHPIPPRPTCWRAPVEDIHHVSTEVSIFSPKFEDYFITVYKIEKFNIVTECYENWAGAITKSIVSQTRAILTDTDLSNIKVIVSNEESVKFIKELKPGDNMLYPKPEDYTCSYWRTVQDLNERFRITAISVRYLSNGDVVLSNDIKGCNLVKNRICVSDNRDSVAFVPEKDLNPCDLKLKLKHPGFITYDSEPDKPKKKKTLISIPEKQLMFWFNDSWSNSPTTCVIDEVIIKHSSDGYLIGLQKSFLETFNNIKPTANNVTNKENNFNLREKQSGAQSYNDSNKINKIDQDLISKNVKKDSQNTNSDPISYESMQKSYARSEVEYGLDVLKNDLVHVVQDISYEICKNRGELWDDAYTNIYQNPSLMARFLYPTDFVKGTYIDNILQISFGEKIQGACIVKDLIYNGLHVKTTYNNTSYWLKGTTGELFLNAPISEKIQLRSFSVPVLPSGYFDLITKTYTSLNTSSLFHHVHSGCLFSNPEMINFDELRSWKSDFSIYEQVVIQHLRGKVTKTVDVDHLFHDYISEPIQKLWNAITSKFKFLKTTILIIGISILGILLLSFAFCVFRRQVGNQKSLSELISQKL